MYVFFGWRPAFAAKSPDRDRRKKSMVLVIGVPRFGSENFPGILGSWFVDLLTVRTTGKKGQKGERVVQNQKGQIQPKNSITTVVACCVEKRVLAFDRSKAKQKEEQWWEEPGDSVFVLFKLLDLGW